MKTLNLKSKDIVSAMRFDGSYHISEGTIFLKKLKRMPHADLISFCPNIFTAGRNKRVYTDKEKGFPYLSNSDVVKNNPFESCNYNSKKYGFDKTAFLKEGMILTGRVGAIGQTSYVTKEFEENQAMGSDNIIRIVAKDKKMSGYIYAFLVSKYGNALFNRLAAGGVQPYISEAMLQDIPIPILPEETQQKIHNLIVDAANLRVEANKLLKEAVAIMEEKLVSFSTDATSSFKAKNYSVKINLLKAHNNRLDATYNAGWFDWFYSKLEKADIQTRTVSELSQKVFTPNIFKRVRTDNPSLGIPFLSGSDLLSAFPKMDSLLSKRMSNIENYILKNGWLAIQDAGTIGYVTYIHEFLNGVAATNNLIRIIPKEEENYNPYIFTFLKSKIGQKILASFEFGSVQKHIDNHQLSALKIPVISEIYDTITTKTISSMEFFSKACFNEKTAIDLIEKEIDQWQQL